MNRTLKMTVATGAIAIVATGAAMALEHPNLDGQLADIATLLEEIEEARANIGEIDVTYTFSAMSGGNPNTISHAKERLRYLDGLIAVDRWQGHSAEELDEPYAYRVAGFDGQSWWLYNGRFGTYGFSSGDDGRAPIDTEAGGFTTFMLWYPCHEIVQDQLRAADLRAVLNVPNVNLRSAMETIGDAACYVVDLMNPVTGDIQRTTWIDPARGYLALRTESLGSGTVWQVDEAVEAAPDVWIPTQGTVQFSAGVVPELPAASTFKMVVESYQVNNGELGPADFNMIDALAPGTTVWDYDNDSMWVVAADDD